MMNLRNSFIMVKGEDPKDIFNVLKAYGCTLTNRRELSDFPDAKVITINGALQVSFLSSEPTFIYITFSYLKEVQLSDLIPSISNSLGEKFSIGDRCYQFNKATGSIKFVPSIDRDMIIEDYHLSKWSEPFTTFDIAVNAKESYNEKVNHIRLNFCSDHPLVTSTYTQKFRPFKMSEAEEFLGLKIKRKSDGAVAMVYNVNGDSFLRSLFNNWELLDGSPVGKPDGFTHNISFNK